MKLPIAQFSPTFYSLSDMKFGELKSRNMHPIWHTCRRRALLDSTQPDQSIKQCSILVIGAVPYLLRGSTVPKGPPGRLTYVSFLKLHKHPVGLLAQEIGTLQGLYLHMAELHKEAETQP
jgi:hypothetical protein